MRCRTLAQAFAARGARCHFICRDLPGQASHLVAEHFIHLLPAPTDPLAADTDRYRRWLGVPVERDVEETRRRLGELRPDLLVVDSYALDEAWEREVGDLAERSLAIDDLPTRRHAVDVLLDANLRGVSTREADDAARNPGGIVLRGPSYALLRAEFRQHRSLSLARRGEGVARRLLITMGGTDPVDATTLALDAVERLPTGRFLVDVLAGPANPRGSALAERAASIDDVTVHRDGGRVAERMAAADIAIAAGGASSWERCCLGLPSLLLQLEANQRVVAEPLHAAGAAIDLGPHDVITAEQLAEALVALADDAAAMRRMSRAAAELVDGRGVERVLAACLDDASSLNDDHDPATGTTEPTP